MLKKISKKEKEVTRLLPFLSESKKEAIVTKINNIKYLQQKTNNVIDFLKSAGKYGDISPEINCLKKEFLIKGRREITKKINLKVEHNVKRFAGPSNNPRVNNNPEANNNPSNSSNFSFSTKAAICISCIVGIIFLIKMLRK